MLESVDSIEVRLGTALRVMEWIITILFSIEYVLRLWTSKRPLRWAVSFYGVIDLLAVLPTYASVFLPGAQAVVVLRGLRLLRIFRILKLFNYVHEARLLLVSLAASRHRIIVFMLAVLALVTVFGTVMYLVEPKEAGFTSIPVSYTHLKYLSTMFE